MEKSPIAGLGGLNSLIKKWDECSTDEKLEKIRNELRDLRYLTTRINNLDNTLYQLQNHQHGIDGKMLVPLNNNSNTLAGQAMRMDYLP